MLGEGVSGWFRWNERKYWIGQFMPVRAPLPQNLRLAAQFLAYDPSDQVQLFEY